MNDKTTNFLSLFASSSTLICCALPAIFVAIGAGASFASLITVFPFLIVLSQYKIYITLFALVMILIAGYVIIRRTICHVLLIPSWVECVCKQEKDQDIYIIFH